MIGTMVGRVAMAVLGQATLWGAFPVTTPATAQPVPTWSIVSSPNRAAGNNDLFGVSCVSATSCQAVGDDVNNTNASRTLIETWNGTIWSRVPSPSPGAGWNYLSGVSCVWATWCTAVGEYESGGSLPNVFDALIEHWNGRAWSVVPHSDHGSGQLSGVSCVSAISCQAVGWHESGGSVARTLIESWNGRAWSIVPSPDPGTNHNYLSGVSCVSATSCTAVGTYSNRDSGYSVLIESWNGTAWSIVPSRSPGVGNSEFNGVSCVSATSCTAVGERGNGAGRTLIESWNGTVWSIVPSPSPGANQKFLQAVSCVSATSCTAVGDFLSSGSFKTLVESWNGSAWSVSATPNRGTYDNDLADVWCVSAASCTAVGGYQNGPDQTLVESYG